MKDSGFPFPLVASKRSEVNARLLELRSELAGTGEFPVIVGNDESVWQLKQNLESHSESLVVPEAIDWDATAWFQARLAEDPEAWQARFDRSKPAASNGIPEIFGAEPSEAGEDSFFDSLFRGLVKKHDPEVLIAKVPAEDSWLLPLKLLYGAWNDCPMPWEHAMIARYWHEKYGAEISTMRFDSLAFTVSRPPLTAVACAELAREQYIYCRDIVDQGMETYTALAESLMGATTWSFWWD